MKEIIALLLCLLVITIPIGVLKATLNTLNTIPTQPEAPIVVGQIIGTPVVPSPTLVPTNGDILEQIIAQARTWLNTPYLWGGCSHKGIDCSCFVLNVYASFNIHVPRTTVLQKASDMLISRDQIRTGDTLFFDNTCTNCGANPTHEGLYIGQGLMIDAGDPVKIESINTQYWLSRLDAIGRPAGL